MVGLTVFKIGLHADGWHNNCSVLLLQLADQKGFDHFASRIVTCCSEPICVRSRSKRGTAPSVSMVWFQSPAAVCTTTPKTPVSYPVMKTLVCLAQPHEVYVLPQHLLLSVFWWLVPCCGKSKSSFVYILANRQWDLMPPATHQKPSEVYICGQPLLSF